MSRPPVGSGQSFAASQAGCIVLWRWGLAEPSWEAKLAVYVLPLAVAAAVVMFITWRLHRKDVGKLSRELKDAQALALDRAQERDLAQEELFRRLYEERELNKEKIQFQSQLTEYEKYAALAQLALGAAHEINNPLLGILSHLELELKGTVDPEQRLESNNHRQTPAHFLTLRGLVSYARPGPLVLSRSACIA
jgi:signal transduction histidine kinase